ncbi:CHASE2 domain-containing protein [Leptolyngbya sp. KIOST-1]|uniref:CHASE2 domain-containing protein n=1 Tax=Leptolyngbya sp. KIOST-1 TaxID=1229172 RepID=UPI000563B8DA|nr:CHASE2 domain-containing protein [Leptolyngbya sp. KIOST-1]
MNRRRSPGLWRLLPGVLAAVAIGLLLWSNGFQALEHIIYTELFELRGPTAIDERLVIVAIDDASLAQLGRFPWPRRYYTQLLNQLSRDRASVVAFNLLWSEPSPEDAQLAEAIAQQRAVVLAQAWDPRGEMLTPVPTLNEAAIATGHIMRQEDNDGLVRRLQLNRQGQPALAIVALQAYSLVAAPATLPDVAAASLWVNWPGPADQFQTFSFADVLQGKVPTAALQNKIVLVGVTAAGLDPLITPFDRNPPASGLHLHAAAIDNLLHPRALKPLQSPQIWLVILLTAPGLSWFMAGWNTRQQLITMVGLCGGWGLLSLGLFHLHYWLPTAAPVSLFVATAAAVALSDRLREDHLLRRQVSYLWEHYHQDLILPLEPGQPVAKTAALPRPRGAVSQVAQLADLAEQLGRSQAMQTAIARTLPMGLLAADWGGTIWFCNPVALDLLQVAVGSPIDQALIPQWLSPAQWQASLATLSLGYPFRYHDIQWNNRWFDLVLQPLPASPLISHSPTSSAAPSFLLVLEETTAHKEAEANLQRAKEAALREAERSEAASRAKGDFLANMSHELRTPLNVILGFTQVISHDQSLQIEHRNHLKIINRSGQHLLGLINDVLEMSKIESGRVQLNETSIDLYALLADLEAMVRFKAESKHLKLTFKRAAELPQYVTTDESKLRQVLLNLVGNAIKFTDVGEVSLQVKSCENRSNRPITLTFQVEDTGLGIAAEELNHLFQPFSQVGSNHRISEGTGLGLAISQKFIRLMGGDITAHSSLGKGSIFQFYIQVALADRTEPKVLWSEGRAIALATNQPEYRILIVEDQWENSQLLVKLLDPIGFQLREARHGQEGVEIWQQWHPHLILMDLRMPVMDGVKATQVIRSIEYDRQQILCLSNATPPNGTEVDAAHLPLDFPNRTKIIALTASVFEETKSNAAAIGCDDFLRKPLQETLLLSKISEHLGVRYIYEKNCLQPADEPNVSLASAQELADLLAEMPSDWIQQLHDCAIRGIDKVILSLIQQIPANLAPLTIALTHWAENFLFDEIIFLTHSQLK